MDPSSLESQHSSIPTTKHMNDAPDGPHNPHGTAERRRRPNPAWRNIVENFSPSWFAIPMDTAILSILMHQLPYQFHGLPVLATIMYVFTLVQFIIFISITILRWTVFRQAAMRKTAGNLDEICFLGAPPIAFLTLAGLTALILSNTSWGGHAWTLVAYVMWWFGMIWMFTTCSLN